MPTTAERKEMHKKEQSAAQVPAGRAVFREKQKDQGSLNWKHQVGFVSLATHDPPSSPRGRERDAKCPGRGSVRPVMARTSTCCCHMAILPDLPAKQIEKSKHGC